MFCLKAQSQELPLGVSPQVQCCRPPAGENASRAPDLSRGTSFLGKSETGTREGGCSFSAPQTACLAVACFLGSDRAPAPAGSRQASRARPHELSPFPAAGLVPTGRAGPRGESWGHSFPQGRPLCIWVSSVEPVIPSDLCVRELDTHLVRPDPGSLSCPSGERLLRG